MRPSQNLPLPPRIYPTFQQLYAIHPESTPPSQNIPHFSTTMILCDPPRIYPSLPEYTPLFNNYMRHSQNFPSLPEYTLPFNNYATLPESTSTSQNIPHFSTTIILCDPPRIYPFLPEYTPLCNNYMRPSHNLPLPPRIYPTFQQL